MKAVPEAILSETYLFGYANQCGTCFRMHLKGEHYLITAKHNAPNIQSGDNITIFRDNAWQLFKVDVIECQNKSADIIAFRTHSPLKTKISSLLPASKMDFYLGQDVFLVGFPARYLELGLSSFDKVNEGYPMPFAKKCIISSFGSKDGIQVICLDTVANKGLSGGAVYYTANGNAYVSAVISHHLLDSKPILDQAGREQHHNVSMYADISYAHNIESIIDTINGQ